MLASEGLAASAFKASEFEEAYTWQLETMHLKDSLLSDDKRNEIARLEAKYKYDKEKAVLKANFEKDKAIEQANLKRQIWIRNLSICGGLGGMLLLASGFVLIKRKREAELNARIATSRLETLRAQLNPHFIFNSLNSINDFVQRKETESASNYLTRFAKMMRKTLDNSTREEVSLGEEVEFLKGYIELERQRLDDRFDYTIQVDNELDLEDTLIPPTLLQPFVENSIWHGLSPRKGKGGLLSIRIHKNRNHLNCVIEDNGVGMHEKRRTENIRNGSFGAASVADRLNLLNQLRRKGESKITYVEKDEGVQVEIQLPIIHDSDL